MPATAEARTLPHVERFNRRTADAGTSIDHLYATLLGLRTFDATGLHQRVEEGLSFAALERLRQVLDLSAVEFARYLGIPIRTLARRRTDGRLHPDESDRLLRLSRIVGLAIRLFEGDAPDARTWLLTPSVALGDGIPLELASTEVGAREVERTIGRLEHGIVL